MKPARSIVTLSLTVLTFLLFLGQHSWAQSRWGDDADDHRQILYVLHSVGDEMTVIDVETNKIIDVLWVGDRPHGLTTPNPWGWGPEPQTPLYVATEGDRGLTVIDPITNEVIKRYEFFGRYPNEIAITSDGRLLYVPAYGDGVYEVFDTEREEIIARIPVDGFPHNTVMSPDDRHVYLMPYDQANRPAGQAAARGLPQSFNNKIYVVDTQTQQVVDTIPTQNAPRPTAISPDGRRLYANINNLYGFIVIDLEARPRRISSVAVYNYMKGISDDPGAQRHVTGVEDYRRSVLTRVHGIAVTPDGKEVWSTDLYHNFVFVFDVSGHTPRQIAKLETGEEPHWVAVAPDGKTVYTANTRDDTISAFDVESKTEIARIQLKEGSRPKRILVLSVPSPAYLAAESH